MNSMQDIRIAILGAGAAGVCTALELANRGYFVDLYDENDRAISRASLNNEGKIHLGLVYAKDRSLKSARTMILGAIHFRSCLSRWIDFDSILAHASTPFYYGVHTGTMMGVEDLERHYAHCKSLLEDACSATGLSYLGLDRTLQAEKLPTRQRESIVDGDHFPNLFRTSERAIDPRALGHALREAVHASPRIRFIPSARVSGIEWTRAGRLQISFRRDGEALTERYDQVANTLWHGRLALDASLGLRPDRGWIFRFKAGGWINVPIGPESLPSLTIVLGPFGDLVNFERRGFYLNWYPIGLIGTSGELTPPNWEASLSPEQGRDLIRRSYDELIERCPALRHVEYSEGDVELCGGVIFAWGDTDIHDASSDLHTRYEIGIHSVKNYHSVNTGKFTMSPYLGYRTAERILGIS
jgi:glycine/D-amino acid oxidase-like deaminating enzyme